MRFDPFYVEAISIDQKGRFQSVLFFCDSMTMEPLITRITLITQNKICVTRGDRFWETPAVLSKGHFSLSDNYDRVISMERDVKNNPDHQVKSKKYLLEEITGRIIGAAMQVHQQIGPGFMEVIYQRALALELPAHGLDFSRETWITVYYKGFDIGKKRVDFFIEGVMVEIKAKSHLEDVDVVQALSYLKASGFEVGLLLNFGAKSLEVKRLIHTPK